MCLDKLSAGWQTVSVSKGRARWCPGSERQSDGEISTAVRGWWHRRATESLFIKELLCNAGALNSVSAGARALLLRLLLLRV